MQKINGNGHAIESPERFSIPSRPTVPPASAMRALRVLSVAQGTTYHVQFLADDYGGCLTHYKKKSHYCKGNDCPAWLHNCGDTTWKGYAAVVVWNAAKKVWMPWVLEITESLELDLRSIVRRGQIWELWRNAAGKRSSPAEGKLLEEDRDPAGVPAAFSVVSVVRQLYHFTAIDLSQRNPMPPRTLVADIEGEGPAVLQRGPELPVDRPEGFSFVDEAKKRLQEKQTPTEKKAGKGF